MTDESRTSRRDDLLAAAAECFVRQGIRGTTMEDIARAAGAGKATLYRYFDNKDAVIDALLALESDRFQRRMQRAVDGCDDVIDGLEAAFVAGVRFFTRHPLLTRGRDEDPGLLLERIASSQGPLVDTGLAWFVEQLRRGQAAGRIRQEVQPALAAEVVMRLLLSYFTFRPMLLDVDDGPELEALAREVVARGLGRRDGTG